jgi:hypothetical protein
MDPADDASRCHMAGKLSYGGCCTGRYGTSLFVGTSFLPRLVLLTLSAIALNLFVSASVVAGTTFSSGGLDLASAPRLVLLTLSVMALNLFVMPSLRLWRPR